MSVEDAVSAEIGAMPVEVRESALAATCLVLARRLDSNASDRDTTALARELRLGLQGLRARVPAQVEEVPGGRVAEMGD